MRTLKITFENGVATGKNSIELGSVINARTLGASEGRNVSIEDLEYDVNKDAFRVSLPYRRIRHQRRLISSRRIEIVRAVAVPIIPSPRGSAAYRDQLCENYGFRQIGEQLPDSVTLRNTIDALPKKVFEIDDMKALKSVFISATSHALGLLMISKAPWYLLPLAWAWTGTAVTGFFVIGHDCAHKSFSKNKLVEDIAGTLAFLPLIYPYEPWRFKHDQHHTKTNMSMSTVREYCYLNEANWNWRLMKTILTICHIYDKDQNYIAFDGLAPEESQPITFLKRVMPNDA
ncbi:hypothetical protein LguiA_011113 [Lonicera macranthoides]